MKGKRTFWSSIVAGACIGGILSLLNKDARKYSKKIVEKTSENIIYHTKNPSKTVQKVKNSVISLNEFVSENTKSAVNALEQVENTFDKFLKDK